MTLAFELVQGGHRQAAAALDPECDAERIAPIEAADVAEAHLRVAVEGRGAAHLADVERGIAGDRSAVLITPGCIREAAVELVMGRETVGLERHRRHGQRLLPFLLQRLDHFVVERTLVRLDRGLELVEELLLRRCRQDQRRFGVAGSAIEPLLRHVVEEGVELIELFVADGIVLVRMAPRAAHRQPHERARRGLDPIHHVFDLILLGDRAAFEVDHVIAVEPRGDLLLARRTGQQISRDLLDDERIEGEIPVERANHPVAPRPHAAQAVDVIAVGVGVARRIQPRHGHALAVARRSQQLVDPSFVRVR